MIKILVFFLFFTSKCFGQESYNTEDALTIATTIIDETTTNYPIKFLQNIKKNALTIASTLIDDTTSFPIEFLQNIKKERYKMPGKQASNVTGTISNISNQVTNTVSSVYNRIPCSCDKGQCGCCTGPLLDYLNQKACLNITYEPDEFAFNAALSLNNREFFKRRISGKNPPPICIRVPRIRVIKLCGRFSNVHFAGTNMHACVGMEASWDDFSLFETLFNCFRIGSQGVAIVLPEDGGGISTNTDEDDEDDDDDDYDDNAKGFGFGRLSKFLSIK